jgi:hypothetical protein
MTSPNNQSLIQGDDQQLKLFGSQDMDPALFAAEEKGPQRMFTGARLFAQNPELYKAIVALSAEGLGAIRIGKILHVSAHTVQAVRQREPEHVAIEKNRIAGLARAGARMCVEWIMDKLSDPKQVKKVSIKDLGIVGGILAEKSELLSGAPTARILNVTATVDYDEYVRGRRDEYERQRMGLSRGNEKTNAPAVAVAGATDTRGPDTDQGGPVPGAAPGAVQRRPIALLEAPKDHQAPAPIVDPGAIRTLMDNIYQEIAKDQVPERTVGKLTHRQDDMPENIDRNEGTKKGADLMSPNDFQNVSTSA